MRTNILRHVAVALGLSVCAIAPSMAQAQTDNYSSPSKWNNFNNQNSTSVFRTVGTGEKAKVAKDAVEHVPAPVPDAKGGSIVQGTIEAPIPSMSLPAASGCSPCQSTPIIHQGPHAQAVQAPWTGSAPVATHQASRCQSGTCGHGYSGRSARHDWLGSRGSRHKLGSKGRLGGQVGAINPYFGGASLLFWDLEENGDRTLLVDDATGFKRLGVQDLGPDAHTGFDIHMGKYINNGCNALDIGFLFFDPDRSEQLFTGLGGSYRAAMPAWNDLTVPGGAASAYLDYDGADGFRARRDLRVQGIEANWVSFGQLGSRRLGNCGYGGAAGPMTSPSGRVQVSTSHGFRWFQLEDAFELAANSNGTPGYQADDVYYNVDTENNLYGYQFGSRLTYCLNSRTNLNIGGKIGIYGNDVTYRQRMGTETAVAYRTFGPTDFIDTEESDTVVSALGELDLGLGYRLNNAWTLTGGYRMLTACGVATAPGSIANEYTSLASSAAVNADDCILLHGGYVGLQYNW